MAWPTDDIATTHLDAATDDPAQARAQLYNALVRLKEVIAGRATTDGVASLDSGGRVPSAQMQAPLASIAGLTTAADRMIYTTASNTYAVATLTSFIRTLLDDANAATARGTLGAAASATSVSAGNGLTGGGDLSTNRTITMGTPGSTTVSSTNAVTTNSHTHALTLTTANVLSLLADTSLGAVGSLAWLVQSSAGTTAITAGSTYAGSGLRYYGVFYGALNTGGNASGGGTAGGTPSGTWRALGTANDTGNNGFRGTLFLRIS